MIKTLMKSIREFKRASILTPLYITLEIILECLLPLVMANLIDKMTGSSLIPIIRYGIILIIMAMLSLFFGYMSGRIGATASCGFAKNLRQDIFYKIQDFSFADIDKFSTSSLVTRMTTDVTNVQNAYQMIIRIAVRTPLMLIFSVIISLTISVKMSLIFLIMIPIVAAALFTIVFIVSPIFKRIFEKYDAMNNSVQENIQGIRVVKSFVREDYEQGQFHKSAADVCKNLQKQRK